MKIQDLNHQTRSKAECSAASPVVQSAQVHIQGFSTRQGTEEAHRRQGDRQEMEISMKLRKEEANINLQHKLPTVL